MRISDWSSDVCSSDLSRRHSPFGRRWPNPARPRAFGGGRMKFSDRLGRRPRTPFHSAIATTFAVEFAAVEDIMLPQLMASGATNLLLIADDTMAALALSRSGRPPWRERGVAYVFLLVVA